MWNLIRSNRLIDEREKIKDHSLHVDRLRHAKASLDINIPPKKPAHLKLNFKKEQIKQDKKSEIQYENRLLLKKML